MDTNSLSLNTLLSALQFKYPLELSEWALSPWHLAKVVNEIIGQNAQTIVELGSGTSSVVISKTLQKRGSGKLFSFDQTEVFVEKIRRRVEMEEIDSDYFEISYAEPKPVIINSKEYYWYDQNSFKEINNIDLVLVDGPSALLPGGDKRIVRYPALPALYEKLSKRSVIILDDYNRADEQEIVRMWQEEFKIEYLEVHGESKGLAILYINK